MKKRILSLALVLALALGAVPAGAYGTPDFSDLPKGHWAYDSVMKMADAGVIKGTGNGAFSPEAALSAEMFITLVGRVVFPGVTAEGTDWSGPYVAEAKAKGLLTGTAITDANLKGGISRYDMAVILAKSVELLKIPATKAETSKVTDYGDIPTKYADAVLVAYGSGLIKGDEKGNFNGQNSMTRQEAAIVMDRLTELVKKAGESGGQTPSVSKPYTLKVSSYNNVLESGVTVLGERTMLTCVTETDTGEHNTAPYGSDYSGLTYKSSDPSVIKVAYEGDNAGLFEEWSLTALSLGTATVTFTDPYGVSASFDVTVVSARENIGTKTFTFSILEARYEEHSLRGQAYTEYHIASLTPYKLYYTRDGGKTSQLIYEGVAPAEASPELRQVELELPEDSLFSRDAGFYVSAEAKIDGQRMVTSDLRTDDRAAPTLIHGQVGVYSYTVKPLLTPPTGEKAKFTVDGAVGYYPEANKDLTAVDAGFTVRLYLKSGLLVAETVTDSNGEFVMDCEVDQIDNGFDTDTMQYYFTASGVQDGVYMESDGKLKNGEFNLYSLDRMGADPYGQNAEGSKIIVVE